MSSKKTRKVEKDDWKDLLQKNEVNLENYSLSEEHIQEVCQNLNSNSVVRHLNLSRNRISDQGFLYLSETLRKNSSITVLNLSFTNLGDIGLIYISEGLEKNSALVNLDLRGNFSNLDQTYSSQAARRFGKALQNNLVLKILKIEGRLMKDEDLNFFLDSLQSNTALVYLNLGGYDVIKAKTKQIGQHFYDLFVSNSTLQSLKITHFQITAEDFELFCKGIQQNSTINSLDLRGVVGDVEASFEKNIQNLREMIANNTSLTSLNLGSNHLKDSEIHQLLPALQKVRKLKELNIDQNSITDKVFQTFADCCNVNLSLTCLSLQENDLGAGSSPCLKNFLQKKSNILRIELSGNLFGFFGDKSLNDIAEGLLENKSLTRLNLKSFLSLYSSDRFQRIQQLQTNIPPFLKKIENHWILSDLQISHDLSDSLKESFFNYKKKINEDKRKILNYLLLSRELQNDSVWTKERLPLDVFKYILFLSHLL